jgi:integral membrane protein
MSDRTPGVPEAASRAFGAGDPEAARRALRRLRIVGLVEGTSFLVLLLVAMPLKYFADMPLAVRYTGWVHGVLFLWFMVELFTVARLQRWGLGRIALVFGAAVVPLGTYVLEPGLRREERSIGPA